MRGLLLAAHGDGDDSESNKLALELGRKAASLGGFEEVAVAFQKGDPSFSQALDKLQGPHLTVVPLMASAGYYCEVVFPRELEKNARFRDFDLTITEPVGTHPKIVDLAQKHIEDILQQNNLAASEASLMVVGHGTKRHSKSRRSTEELTAELGRRLGLARLAHAFLDEDPGPEDALASLPQGPCLVLPFLMGAGTHATRDLPRRLARENVHILSPLGALPGIVEIILLRAQAQIAIGA